MLFLLFASLAIQFVPYKLNAWNRLVLGNWTITQDAPGKVHLSCQEERERQHDDVLIFVISVFRMGSI